MNPGSADGVAMVDLVFPLRGGEIDADYGEALADALGSLLPWLAAEAGAAVLPLERVAHHGHQVIVAGRSRLVLRLPEARADEARGLAGRRLDLGGGLDVGAASPRALRPFEVLYASFVDLDATEEGEFVVACRSALDALGLAGQMVCGRRRRASTRAGERRGHSVMVSGLRPEESLRLQRVGLGQGHLEGRGVFVPHKSVAAVGE